MRWPKYWSFSFSIIPSKEIPGLISFTFPGGASGKEPACQCRRPEFDPWLRTIPWRKKRQPSAGFLPAESHGQEEPGGATVHEVGKESDRTWRLNSNKHTSQNFPSPSLHAERRGSEHSYTALYRCPRCPHSELVHLRRPRLCPH